MGGDVDISVLSGGLEQGADVASATAIGAEAVVRRLAGIALDPAVLGQVDQATPLASALGSFVGGVRDVGEKVATRHDDLSRRARTTAALGGQLVDDTTQVAGRVVPAADPAVPR